ncbi:M23 family metallopeptidase [Allorhizobium sp. BGMRC 0089]|uniref:M23 family metallopeptidase n=1 Tax=Allorhizobium sonneratiae TaxID=2934936 RepID=UPI00203411C8|nr:M23 family metallopeptidase [Allorhizobium sonneratiae]MCM2293597.1 M23 family metallopeptidase [Allorhizobium sonneratiae]
MRKNSMTGFAGKPRKQHVLILASGDTIRHMTLKPWMAGVAIAFVAAAIVGYLGATAYLVMRDDLIGVSMARQARLQHDYEDRISALRAQVDRVTSRQLLDQQVVEEKLQTLLEQQMALSARSGRLGTLLDRAETSGLTPDTSKETAATLQSRQQAELNDAPSDAVADNNMADRADRVFQNVTLSLKRIEQTQQARIRNLTEAADSKADAIDAVLKNNAIKVDAPQEGKDAMGGPFIDANPKLGADTSLNGLDTALDRLDAARSTVKDMPFANPAPTHEITSPFGTRTDPLLGRLAMHPGVDFRAGIGAPIRAAGAGTVVFAGQSNGYGNMVEIDHGQGVTTRYGHMSKLLSHVGEKVEEGQVIGLAGSTGRSTGPHLHYEIRRNGVPVNPMGFLTSGLKLHAILE